MELGDDGMECGCTKALNDDGTECGYKKVLNVDVTECGYKKVLNVDVTEYGCKKAFSGDDGTECGCKMGYGRKIHYCGSHECGHEECDDRVHDRGHGHGDHPYMSVHDFQCRHRGHSCAYDLASYC